MKNSFAILLVLLTSIVVIMTADKSTFYHYERSSASSESILFHEEKVEVFDQLNQFIGTGVKIAHMVFVTKDLVQSYDSDYLHLLAIDQYNNQYKVIYIWKTIASLNFTMSNESLLILDDPKSISRVYHLIYRTLELISKDGTVNIYQDFDEDGEVTSFDLFIGMMGHMMKNITSSIMMQFDQPE